VRIDAVIGTLGDTDIRFRNIVSAQYLSGFHPEGGGGAGPALPSANGNLSRFSIPSAIARNSGVFSHNEFPHEGRTVRFRKAPARLFSTMMEFPDGHY